MRRFALLTLAAFALLVGGAQARIVSSSVEAGQFPLPETAALLKHPSHRAILEVRTSRELPVEVSWRVHCRSKAQNRVSKHRITTMKLPLRALMPVLVRDARYCHVSAGAGYQHDLNGRIAVLIRY
jgi:hypothetical protein